MTMFCWAQIEDLVDNDKHGYKEDTALTNPSINLCLKESLTTCPNCSSVDFWPDQAKPINVKEKAIDVAFECRYCGLEALLSFKFTHASWFNSEHEDVDLGL